MSGATAVAGERQDLPELEPWLLTPDYVDRLEQTALDAKAGGRVAVHPTVALQVVRHLRHHAEVDAEYAEQVLAYEEGVSKAVDWLEEGGDVDTALHYLREADRKVHQVRELEPQVEAAP